MPMIDPRSALNLCVGSTALVWMMLIFTAVCGRPSPLGYALVTLCIANTSYLYWRYKGIVW